MLRVSSVSAVAVVLACGSEGTPGEGGGTSGGSSTGVVDPSTTSTTGEPTSSTSGLGGTGTGSSGGEESTGVVSTGGPGTSTGEESTGGESSSSGGEASTGEAIDCMALPQGLLPYTSKFGPFASEDLAFDHEGNLVGAENGDLFRSPFDGAPTLWVPGAGGFIAGLRMTAKGVVVYADNDTATLFKVEPGTDFKQMVVGGLEYANGLEVDNEGFVYVAEQSGSRVRRVDPATGQFTILAEGVSSANGLSFSPDYRTLYVGSFGGGTITAIRLKEDFTTESVELFAGGIGGGALDGMAVDACGNVYVCEFGPAIIWRITPDGLTMAPLIDLGMDTSWIPNMQWGSGIGGWDDHTMYVLDFGQNRVFEVPLGVPDKHRVYP